MRRSQEERGVRSVNVEVPGEMLRWIDQEARRHETGRSGLFRIAVREMMERRERELGMKAGNGGAK